MKKCNKNKKSKRFNAHVINVCLACMALTLPITKLYAEEKPAADHGAKPKDEKAGEEKKVGEGEEKPKDRTENSSRVKLEMSVSRFGVDNVTSLVTYLFFFQCNSIDTADKIYAELSWFKGSILVKLTEYLSNPAHDPKNLTELKVFLIKLANKFVNERFAKKDEKGKRIFLKFITNVYINKVFERKLK